MGGTHVHDYWGDYESDIEYPPTNCQNLEEVTQMIFVVDDAHVDPEMDKSFKMITSKWIDSIEVVDWPNGTQNYRDFMRSKGMCINSNIVSGPFYITHDNYDSYSHVREDGEGLFAWDIRISDSLDSQNHAVIGRIIGDDNSETDIVFTRDVPATNWPGKKSDYFAWNKPVFLPMQGHFGDGTEAKTFFSQYHRRDRMPGKGRGQGNYHLAIIYGKYQLWTVHQNQNSIPVSIRKSGSLLNYNAHLGNMGSSGLAETSQLHISMIWYDAETDLGDWEPVSKRAWSIPVEFCDINESLYTLKSGGLAVEKNNNAVPQECSWISSENFCTDGTADLDNCSGATPNENCSNDLIVEDISIPANTWGYYVYNVAVTALQLNVNTKGGSGDADLYVKRADNPTKTDYNCASENSTNEEKCTLKRPEPGPWHIGIFAIDEKVDNLKLSITSE